MRTYWNEVLEMPIGVSPPEGECYTAMTGRYEQIIGFLDDVIVLQKTRGVEPLYGFRIQMPCGYKSGNFITHDDIPREDLPCPCGKGYLIKII